MKLTPAQQQYLDIKKNYKDAILFFRMWDFYEVFYDDAKICAKVLDIALTTRDKNSKTPIPMAWIPYHAVDKYLPKLIQAGYKVAIAEQVWEVVPWKVVERKVTQVITPWTYVKEEKNENYILSCLSNKWKYFLAWWDISEWIYHIQEVDNLDTFKDTIFKIYPKEIVLPLNIENKEEIEDFIWKFLNPYITHWTVPYHFEDLLKNKLQISSFDSFWKALDADEKKQVLAMLFDYVESLNQYVNVFKVKYEESIDYVYFDMLTIKNLEILQSNYDQDKKHSLLAILDHTVTSAWKREFKQWVLHPLKNKNIIDERLLGFEYFMNNEELSNKIKEKLKEVYDIERLYYLINFKQNSPFHWLKLKISLSAIKNISILDNKYIDFPKKLDNLLNELEKWLKDWDFSLDKDFIKDGYSEEVDKLRQLAYHSDQLLISYQQELIQKLGVPVKIRYVNNQWYLIEVTKKDAKKFEENANKILSHLDSSESHQVSLWDFARKQTLKSAERYVSNYLKEIEEKSLDATFRLQEKEKEILETWKEYLKQHGNLLESLAKQVAMVDIFVNVWKFFKDNNYSKPKISLENDWIKIIWGRHPVIEKFLPQDEEFIENNLEMVSKRNWKNKNEEDIVHIITGPNMWWKSTYLRQNALILLLAHCGLYVPARKCETYILSWIFARVGSWDVLVKNQSTFMTEMIEVANILNNADEKSFIIFDELWRWTSTYDGLAISQAVVEYIVEKLKAKTLFATHYHELINLEKKYPWKVKNFSVWVYENWENIIFLKKILPWWADKSYWIYVAKLAWLPDKIIEKAREIEKNIWECSRMSENKRKVVINPLFDFSENEVLQKDKEKIQKYEKIKQILESLDIYNTTPIKALEILEELKGNI